MGLLDFIYLCFLFINFLGSLCGALALWLLVADYLQKDNVIE